MWNNFQNEQTKVYVAPLELAAFVTTSHSAFLCVMWPTNVGVLCVPKNGWRWGKLQSAHTYALYYVCSLRMCIAAIGMAARECYYIQIVTIEWRKETVLCMKVISKFSRNENSIRIWNDRIDFDFGAHKTKMLWWAWDHGALGAKLFCNAAALFPCQLIPNHRKALYCFRWPLYLVFWIINELNGWMNEWLRWAKIKRLTI